MEKNKIQTIILAGLALVIIIVWGYIFFRGNVQDKPLTGKLLTKRNIRDDFFLQQKKLEKGRPVFTWSRNPFCLKPKRIIGVSAISEFKVSGIAADEKGRMAIINGEIVRKGDIILGIKIIDISENTVKVQKEGKEYILNVH